MGWTTNLKWWVKKTGFLPIGFVVIPNFFWESTTRWGMVAMGKRIKALKVSGSSWPSQAKITGKPWDRVGQLPREMPASSCRGFGISPPKKSVFFFKWKVG